MIKPRTGYGIIHLYNTQTPENLTKITKYEFNNKDDPIFVFQSKISYQIKKRIIFTFCRY